MIARRTVLAALIVVLVPVAGSAEVAGGAGDCIGFAPKDFGDAPECVPAYPSGVIGQFPTCRGECGMGDQTMPSGCVPISTPPGPTGYVEHHTLGPFFWLGCVADSVAIDAEGDGKTGTPAGGSSACDGGPTDCVEVAWGMSFDQDECYFDGVDAGITSPVEFVFCSPSDVTFEAYSCGPGQQAHLNILVDWNSDGDWNDVSDCSSAGGDDCVYEWAVKNAPITLDEGCNLLTSPGFLAGPHMGQAWMRITISEAPVSDDFPWAGSMGLPGDWLWGGETEDYPVNIVGSVPTKSANWSTLKSLYR